MLRAFLVAPIGAAFVYAALFLIDPLDGPGSGAVFSYTLFWRPNQRLQPAAADAIASRRG